MLARAQLPTAAPRIGAKRTAELMAMDKKVLGGSVRLVLLEGFGKAVVSGRYDARALEATLAEHFG
jgi:3-dehydroquinate synthase